MKKGFFKKITVVAMLASAPLMLGFAQAAQAGAGSGSSNGNGDGTGNGGCVLSDWGFIKNIDDLRVGNNTKGARCDTLLGRLHKKGEGSTDSVFTLGDAKTSDPNSRGSVINRMNQTGATTCVANASDPGWFLFYVRDAIDKKWTTSNGGGDDDVQDWGGVWSNHIAKRSPGDYPAPSAEDLKKFEDVSDAELMAYNRARNPNLPNTALNRYRVAAYNALYNELRGKDNLVLACVYPDKIADSITCDQLVGHGSNQYLAGRNGNSRATDPTNCFVRCPEITVPSTNGMTNLLGDVRVRTDNSGKYIPATVGNSNAARGAWCFDASVPQREYRTLVDNASTGYQPYAWITEVNNGGPSFAATGQTKTDVSPQASDVLYTPWGELLRSKYADKKYPTASEANVATTATAVAPHATVDLNATNKTAMAQGGVMNVIERTTYATLDETRTRAQQRTVTRNVIYNVASTNGPSFATNPAWGAASTPTAWATTNDDYNYVLSSRMTPDTRLWQQMANHCNASGYNSARTNATEISNDDSSKNYSGAARTTVRAGTNPRWGQGAVTPNGTNTLGFYDKECGFAGVRSTDGNDPVAAGTAGTQVDYTYFRDNTQKPFKVDLFTPSPVANLIRYNGEEALSTTVNRWAEGTPQPENISERGTFSMLAGTQKVFSKASDAAPGQRNFSVDTGTGRTFGITDGQTNTFQVAGNWPSDKGKPSVFSIKWEYAPNVANTFATTRVGFGEASGARSGTLEKVWTPIQGKIYGSSNATSPAQVNQQASNTGSSVANGLDGALPFGLAVNAAGEWTTNPNTHSPYYSTARFVRATTE